LRSRANIQPDQIKRTDGDPKGKITIQVSKTCIRASKSAENIPAQPAVCTSRGGRSANIARQQATAASNHSAPMAIMKRPTKRFDREAEAIRGT
jgi:hypothetical protein